MSALQKLQAGVEAAGRQSGLAFSLNLSIGREGALIDADDRVRLLSGCAGREFRKAIGHVLPYSFVLELARDEHGFDRLHAHGVVIPGDADLDLVRQALIRAGGKIEHDPAWSRKQLDLKPITEATGWMAYITKARRWGKAVPAGRYTFASTPLKNMAKLHYEQFGLSPDVSFVKPRSSKKKEVSADLCVAESSNIYCFSMDIIRRIDSFPSRKTPTRKATSTCILKFTSQLPGMTLPSSESPPRFSSPIRSTWTLTSRLPASR